MTFPVAILGPTASGKSALALKLAEKLGGVIIGADAFQAYEGLETITAAPSAGDKQRIEHRLYSFLKPEEPYNAYFYQRDCRREIEDVLSKGKTPLIVGGTLLYARAALFGYEFESFETAQVDGSLPTEALYAKLEEMDPSSAREIHPHNRVRIIRALSMAMAGHPKSARPKADMDRPYYEGTKFLYLVPRRDELYRRIDARVDKMIENGAVEEVGSFIWKHGPDCPAARAIGVREIAAYLKGRTDLETAKENIRKATRNYAKRQLTFLRHQFPEGENLYGRDIL